ncbi:sterol desaturase family protein [Alcanivorax sp. 1008]|uniref:sterol desaturase family protein n=1 Tax=Alcanivorax sp. 1008 TaxID=2816853 RepID=UPI001D3C573A|nr:sterol desaturase family protein [Alcanivorax sp. 1008]MCC1495492.1 sterol desaturase family protein [Alcanivorax sp. 1008]
MQNVLLAYATPFFFALILAEAWWARRKGKEFFEFSDSLTSIGCGVFTVTIELFAKTFLLGLFIVVEQRFAVWHWPVDSWLTWLVFFILLDFVYYWAHRWSHEINFFWGGHVPHHQSEHYNLTTALRQGAWQDISHWPLYLVLALAGCPASVFIILLTVSKLYQFWIHTRLIDKIPLIEGIFNTPSAHRVHHGINDPYIDRNHGGTLMIWDRIFGTYVKEGEPVVFGVRKAFHSRNPLTAHVDWLVTLWRDASLSYRWQDRFTIWFRRTGWRPEGAKRRDFRPPFSLEKFRLYAPVLDAAQKRTGFVWFMLAIVANSTMLLGFGHIGWGAQLLLAALVTVTLWRMAVVFSASSVK